MIRKFYHESLRGKIGLAVTLIVLLTFIAVPCVTRAKAVTTLTLWTHQRHMADLIKELIGEFNATAGKEKGIQITMRVLGDDSWNLFQDAQTRGEGPDLYSSGFITKYADPFKAEAQMCFDELPGFKEWKRQWPSWYWIEELTTHQGHVFTIPVQVFNSRLIYNRDLFRRAGLNPDNPPRSYAELREAARKISRIQPGKIYGFAYCGADAWPVTLTVPDREPAASRPGEKLLATATGTPASATLRSSACPAVPVTVAVPPPMPTTSFCSVVTPSLMAIADGWAMAASMCSREG